MGPVTGRVPERLVDLQTHSTCSDGSLAPERIVERAAEIGLAAVALTDHDTVEGLPAFRAAGEAHGVETIDGIELSARTPYEKVDLLGYFVDPDDATLADAIERLQRSRAERLPKMLDALADLGAEISQADVREHAGSGAIGRPHVAQALVEAGYAEDVDDAFDTFIGDEAPAYVAKERIPAPEAIDAIHAAGGLAVLAHPCFVHPMHFEDVLELLVEAGLDGIEVHYPKHDPQHVRFFSAKADEHGLVATGGSDFHGDVKPHIELGRGMGDLAVPYSVVERLRERLGR